MNIYKYLAVFLASSIQPSNWDMTLAIALELAPEHYALILAVDRILDMCRTSVNVTGDLVTTTVMQKFSGSKPAP